MNESFRSLRWDWLGFGWFLSVALTSFILLTMTAAGLVAWDDAPTEGLWMSIALVAGFFVVGFFVGTRVVAAPVLHAIGMGLLSLIVWLALNLLFCEPLGATTWGSVEPVRLVGLLILQIAAAAVGTRMGVRWMRKPASPAV